jgi:hypothetical protein
VVDYETTRPEFRPLSDEIFGGSPDQVPEKYYNSSPINFVQNVVGRLLIIQGMQDATVSPENVRVVAIALQNPKTNESCTSNWRSSLRIVLARHFSSPHLPWRVAPGIR